MLNKQKKIRFSEDINNILKVRCKQLMMNESEYIRATIMLESSTKYLTFIKEFKEELKVTNKELSAIGINLNQLTRLANKEKNITEKMQLEIIEFREKIVKLLSLLGSV